MKHELSQLLLAMYFENNIRSITNDHLFRDIELIVIVYAMRGLAVSPCSGNKISYETLMSKHSSSDEFRLKNN